MIPEATSAIIVTKAARVSCVHKCMIAIRIVIHKSRIGTDNMIATICKNLRVGVSGLTYVRKVGTARKMGKIIEVNEKSICNGVILLSP